MTNPYTQRMLALLGDKSPIEVLEKTPSLLRRVTSGLKFADLDESYSPGKWSAHQIICHMADVEIGVAFRLRQALAEDNHTIQPFDQDRWAARYSGLDASLAVESFSALRTWNLCLIRNLGPADLERPAMHPERGPESVDIIIRMLAGHDLNHLAQLEQVGKGASA